MALRVPGGVFGRVVWAAVLICTGALPALGQSRQTPSNQKPDAGAQAQAQAQQQEIQSLVRIADTAMSGQPAPAELPYQLQYY